MRKNLEKVRKIVIKIGTSSISYPSGKLNLLQIEKLVDIITNLNHAGKEVILVSSGAIGAGMGILGLTERPHELAMKQACASIGQAHLMQFYQRYFAQNTLQCAQILLTKDVLEHEEKKKNVVRTFDTLLGLKVIPIVNENDTVSTDEIVGSVFSDNDQLASLVAIMNQADLLLLLTTTDGLWNSNHERISMVSKIDETILSYVGSEKSPLGKGGMATKLDSIKRVNDHGIDAVVMSSQHLDAIYSVLDGQDIGTFFQGEVTPCKK